MRFTGSRMVFALTAALAIAGPAASKTSADAIYSVKEVGPVDSTGNYLNDLSTADQAAFRAGSFDQYAHPAVGSPFEGLTYNGEAVPYTTGTHAGLVYTGLYTTSNNMGVDIGSASYQASVGDSSFSHIAAFTPDPHTASESTWGGPPYTAVQSPGYVNVLDPGGPSNLIPAGINDHDQAIANLSYKAYGSFPGGYTADLYVPNRQEPLGGGQFYDLGTLGTNHWSTKVEAINNAGLLVGWSTTNSGAQHAFLDSASTFIMQDLNSLIPPTSGLTLTDAVGIDADGRIVAYGTDASGATHEYLLTPVPQPAPEPTTLALFGLVAIAFGARRLAVRRRVAA